MGRGGRGRSPSHPAGAMGVAGGAGGPRVELPDGAGEIIISPSVLGPRGAPVLCFVVTIFCAPLGGRGLPRVPG
eukprot:1596835-Lingulodinium_polyedra.AAC.1